MTNVGGVIFERLAPNPSASPYAQRTDMGQPWSQRKNRRGQMYKDQHGRRMYAETELKSGHPCGPFEFRFTAPLVPEQKYIELSRDPERPYDVFVNYERWEQDIRSDRRDWEHNGRQWSRKMYGEKYDGGTDFTREVLELIGPPPQAVEPIIAARQGNSWILGLSPKVDMRLVRYFEPEQLDRNFRREREPDFRDVVSVEPDRSELDEEHDPNALGGHRVPVGSVKARSGKEKAKRAPTAYALFVKERMKAGLSMTQAAQEWKAQKEPA